MSSKYYQGQFNPRHPEKCINLKMGKPITYRSNWEKAFMSAFLDSNINVLEWGSELIKIPYFHPIDQKVRNYIPDFIMKVKDINGNIVTYVVEIKPYNQAVLRDGPKKKSKKAVARYLAEAQVVSINEAKWSSCQKFCEENGFKFKVITEKELGIH